MTTNTEIYQRLDKLESSVDAVDKRLERLEQATSTRGDEGHKRDILLESIRITILNHERHFDEIRKNLSVQNQRLYTLFLTIIGATLSLIATISIKGLTL